MYVYSNTSSTIPGIPLIDYLLHENFLQVFNQSTTSSSITASLPAGTYYYYAGPAGTLIRPYNLVVTGSQSVTITFPSFYLPTFGETGVNSGTAWSIIGTASQSGGVVAMFIGSSTSSSMSLYLPNGVFFLDYGAGSVFIQGP